MTSNPMRAAWLCTPLVLMLCACGGPPASAPPAAAKPPPAPDPWPQFAARFIEDYLRANPLFAVQAGRHEYDGQMADFSAAGIAAEVARLNKERAEVQRIDPAGLSADERIERARYQLHVTAAAVPFRTAAGEQPGLLEHMQMVGEQVGRHREHVRQVRRGDVAESEGVGDQQPGRVG